MNYESLNIFPFRLRFRPKQAKKSAFYRKKEEK